MDSALRAPVPVDSSAPSAETPSAATPPARSPWVRLQRLLLRVLLPRFRSLSGSSATLAPSRRSPPSRCLLALRSLNCHVGWSRSRRERVCCGSSAPACLHPVSACRMSALGESVVLKVPFFGICNMQWPLRGLSVRESSLVSL